MKKCFIWFGAFNLLLSLFLWIYQKFFEILSLGMQIMDISLIVYNIIKIIILTVVFYYLMSLLKKKHVYEYKNHKKSMYAYFYIHLFGAILNTILVLQSDIYIDKYWPQLAKVSSKEKDYEFCKLAPI